MPDETFKNPTTPEHFEIFKQEALKWIDWFALYDWRIDFRHEKCVGESFAEAWYKNVGCYGTLVLNTDWEITPVTEEQLSLSAFHECAELWLASVNSPVKKRNYDEDELEKENHRLIRLLENRVWRKSRSA